jgi:hypothetical protein
MLSAMRDCLLAFCPAALRLRTPSVSPPRTLRAAIWGGLAQFLLAATALVIRFKTYFVYRAHELGPHVGGTTEVVEAGVAVFITLEYLVHPFSLFLLYLAVEGLVRFAAGLLTAEVVPNFFVFLGFKIARGAGNRQEQRRLAALPSDTLEELPDGRIRIASAQPKQKWNASITISVSEKWFELDSAQAGSAPRPYIYLLRPTPPGKVLRGFEEYDPASAGPRQSRVTAEEGNAPSRKK